MAMVKTKKKTTLIREQKFNLVRKDMLIQLNHLALLDKHLRVAPLNDKIPWLDHTNLQISPRLHKPLYIYTTNIISKHYIILG